MNKGDILKEVSTRNPDITQRTTNAVLNEVLDVISDALVRGEDVSLHTFGTFRTKIRKPKRGRNPVTGEEITIPARRAFLFKPGKDFRDKLKKLE